MAFGFDDFAVAVGLTGLAKEVLGPLLKGSLEDYTKDFFKGCIEDVVGLAEQEPVQKAMGKALKAFVELMLAELEYVGLTGAEIRDFYQPALRAYMKDADVKTTLGAAFEPDCKAIDHEQLRECWMELDLRQLPDDFDWEQISKQYVRKVKGIWRESPELRELLTLHNQEAIRQGVESLVGIEPDFDLRKYQEGLREQYGNLKLESLDTSAYAYNELKLWRMFIPQDVRPCQEFNPKVYEIPKEKLQELQERGELDAEELEAAQLEAYRRYMEQLPANVLEVVGRTAGKGERSRPLADYAVILGDPGSGKSTLLQYIALEWAAEPIGSMRELEQRPLPLLIELRRYAKDRQEKKCSSVVEYLHQGEVVCRLNQHRLDEVLRQGNAVALFDGIDEVFNLEQQDIIKTDIHRFTNNYPAVQTVVTSRWLGYETQTLRGAGFQHYMLQDLNKEQIEEFVERWHDQTFPEGADKQRKRERLHKAISDSKAIRELAGNPLLLTMMAILNRNQELPRDRPELYNQASRVLLHQWDVERNLIEHRLDPLTIDYSDKQAMLRQVADYMQSGKDGLAGNIISAADLERVLTEQLQRLDLEQPRMLARLMMKQLRERNFILCFLGADNYAFVHRTFLEYFAAWAFVWKFEKTQEISFEELLEQTFAAHWQNERWHEILRLIAGMLEPRFVKKIIEFLLEKNGEEARFANVFLAANCLTEAKQSSELYRISEQLWNSIEALTQFAPDNYYDPYDYDFKWIRDIRIKAVMAIGSTWTESIRTISWLKAHAQSDNYFDVRFEATHQLAARYANDPDTLPILKKRVELDKDYPVRRIALQEIANKYQFDSDTLTLLKIYAQSDSSSDVRAAALQSLAQHYKNDPDTLLILKTCAQFDEHYDVRRVALQGLACSYQDGSDLFDFLCDRTCNDPYKFDKVELDIAVQFFNIKAEIYLYLNPRYHTLKALIDQYPNHSKTLELLADRAQNDNDDQLKEWASKQLAKLEAQS